MAGAAPRALPPWPPRQVLHAPATRPSCLCLRAVPNRWLPLYAIHATIRSDVRSPLADDFGSAWLAARGGSVRRFKRGCGALHRLHP